MDNRDMIKSVRAYREKLLCDPYRPLYHFAAPDDDGRPGDPNGCFYAGGLHHLMYLYRRNGGAFHWGHVSSHDLLHWRHYPDSLAKGPADEGCFSGGAFVDDDGTAYLTYWIFNEGDKTDGRNAGIGLAKSRPPYENWERLPDAVIRSTRWGIRDDSIGSIGCADPGNIWKDGGKYYVQLGNLCVLNAYGRAPDSPADMRGDWTELFSSDDLHEWKYEGRFYSRRADNAWTDETEDNMCPSYLPLPSSRWGGAPSGKMLELFIAHNKGCQYYIGRREGLRFIPESHGRMSWNDNAFFAPEAYIDDGGRQIMFAWLLDNLENDFEKYGWSGVYGLPRSLWLRGDGTLGIAPVGETENLRFNERVHAVGTDVLDIGRPDCCEISAAFTLIGAVGAGVTGVTAEEDVMPDCSNGGDNPSAAFKAGVRVESGAYCAELYFSSRENALVMDLTKSGSPVRAIRESAPLTLDDREDLRLRVFVDRSVLEIFANDRQAISRRVYFPNPDDIRISLIREGAAAVTDARSWELAATNPY